MPGDAKGCAVRDAPIGSVEKEERRMPGDGKGFEDRGGAPC